MPSHKMRMHHYAPYRGTSEGRCIYCLEIFPTASLTEEHVVPYALNGTLTIAHSVCETCRAISNESYEQKALQSDFLLPRLLLELKRRKKKQKKNLPPVAILPKSFDATKWNPEEFEELPKTTLEPFEHPPLMHFLMPVPAGKLVGIERDGGLDKGFQFQFVNTGRRSSSSLPTIIDENHNHTQMSLTLAKIGYCYAVAELGLDGFDGSEIRDLLLGRRSDVYNFVGRTIETTSFSKTDLHHLYLRDRFSVVTVIVNLFASYGVFPYEIVVGAPLK